MLELGDFSFSMPQFDVMAIHELLGLTFCCLVIGCPKLKAVDDATGRPDDVGTIVLHRSSSTFDLALRLLLGRLKP
jgi:hypothetical protein